MNRLAKFGALVGGLISSGEAIDDQLFIDAGSSNTRIYLGERLVYAEPTCVAVHRPSDTVVAIGTKAQKLLGKTGENMEVSFPVQHGVVANPTHMEIFLSTVLKRIVADFSLKRTILGLKTWYAVPASASPVEKQFIKEILASVGFSKVHLLPGIEAAFHNVIEKSAPTQSYLVLNIGGQIVDIGVFSANNLVTGRTIKWGGVQFTETIQEVIRHEHECAVGWHIAEQTKFEIARIPGEKKEGRAKAKATVRGKDVIKQISKTVVVTADIFDANFSELMDELFDALETFLSELPSELATSALDQGIYLTGAASQLDGLGEALAEKLQSVVNYSQQPEMDTVKGMVKYVKNHSL